MEPLTMIVIAVIALAVMGGLGGTSAGRAASDKLSAQWDKMTAPQARRSEMGRRAATVGRGLGWAAGLGVRAVRSAVDTAKARRGRSGSASTASSATGAAGPAVAGPSATGPRPAGPSAPGGADDLFDQDADRPQVPDADLPPGPQAATTAVDGGTGPIPDEASAPDYVDADDFWSTPPAVRAAPAEAPAPAPALTATDSTDTEDAMSQELDTVSAAGVAISHQQARAALARIRGNVALQRQIASQNATALSTLAAYWEQVGMDPVVLTAIYEAMMTSQTSRSSADLLLALADRVSAVLATRGHDAVAAVAAGLNLAKDSGYYTQQ